MSPWQLLFLGGISAIRMIEGLIFFLQRKDQSEYLRVVDTNSAVRVRDQAIGEE